MCLRNKLLISVVFLLVAPVSIAAQEGAPGLEVSDPRFRYDVNAGVDPLVGFSGRQPSPMTTVTDSPVQEVSALFLNTGAKAIKSVSWEYIVFKDAEEKKILRVHSIRSDRVILPGESVRLKMEGYRLQNSQYEKARVTEIKYADGNVWRGTRTKG